LDRRRPASWLRAREELYGDLLLACVRVEDLGGVRPAEARHRLAAFGERMNAVRREIELGRSLGHVVLTAVMLDGGLVFPADKRKKPRR
jgi:hypothetical protein